MSTLDLPSNIRHVVVEGPIGVGKTTLAKQIQQWLGANLLLEEFEENPFLPLLYKDYQQYALQTELFFLLTRRRQNLGFHQALPANAKITSDYMFSKCRVFANLTLPSTEFALFDEVYQLVIPSIPKPDLIIYLDAPVETLQERISQRGRKLETTMSSEYLANLRAAYQTELQALNPAHVLQVDTSQLDLRTPSDQQALMELVLAHVNTNLTT
jgi:deoxyguanosine kinase